MATLRGGCHCGKVEVALDSRRDPATLHPRACDCSSCRKHGAAWVSDADGRLAVTVRDDALHEYRQGSGNARFLLCAECGVLVAVVFGEGDNLVGAVNAGCLDDAAHLGAASAASPQTLGPDAKIVRWRQLWTPARIAR